MPILSVLLWLLLIGAVWYAGHQAFQNHPRWLLLLIDVICFIFAVLVVARAAGML